MRMMTKLLGISMALIAFAVTASAQTPVYIGIGSSALFLQLGQAANATITSGGVGATCIWSQSSSATTITPTPLPLEVTDPTTGQTETGNAWIAWTTGTRGTCAAPTSSAVIYAQLQTDSVIGNRCLFNKCKLGAATNPTGSTPSQLISSSEIALPAAVWNALAPSSGALAVTAAATDIRPEDAAFATLRATTACPNAVSGSQYLGLGYTSGGTPISSYYSSSTFHVTSFTLPVDGSYAVIPVGAVPVLVAVNPSNASGFGASGVTNIDHTTLAKFLDGSYGYTNDLSGAGSANATVLIREPLSGTYNTMEYSIPNSTTDTYGGYDLQTSQDVGLTQPASEVNCNAGVPKWNPLHRPSADNPTNGYANRVIGTGQMVSKLLSTTDALGYAFWSTANFAAATPTTGKYLTVDGVDPLFSSYSTTNPGEIPTAGNGLLSSVNFAHLQDGTYPIWSLLRLVTSNSGTTNYTYANKLAQSAQNFISQTARPDFVPFNVNSVSGIPTLKVFHSHFAPPGVNFYSTGSNVPANGTSAFVTSTGASAAPACTDAEAGGDVGGAIGGVASVLGALPTSDQAYCAAGNPAGQTGYRK